MSKMEHNKGKLIPFNLTEEIAKILVEGNGESLEPEFSSYLEQLETDYTWYDEDIVFMSGNYYKVEFEIKRGELYDFAEAKQNDDGSIDFNTYHYNGGAHWTEVVERALK